MLHQKEKEMYLAETLSRAYQSNITKNPVKQNVSSRTSFQLQNKQCTSNHAASSPTSCASLKQSKTYRRNREHLIPAAEKIPSGNPPIKPAITQPSRRPTYSEALKSTPISRDLKMTALVSTNREGNSTQPTSSIGIEHSKPTPTPVTTRYGRVVKPPTRYTQ